MQWTADGVPVSTATGNQSAPTAVPWVSNGAFVVVWRDGRSGTINGQIYAARLQSGGVLPLRSLTLSAKAENGKVNVQWNTVDEDNTARFVVEKSVDGTSFLAIGSRPAKGSGNGQYMFQDVQPAKGSNFYRIKTIDVNNSFAYSSVAAIDFSGSVKAAMSVYPNPVHEQATVQLDNVAKGTYILSVRDLAWHLLLQKAVSVSSDYQQVTIPMQGFSAGTYFLQLAGNSTRALNTLVQKK